MRRLGNLFAAVALVLQVAITFGQGVPTLGSAGNDDPIYLVVCSCLEFLDHEGKPDSGDAAKPDPAICPVAQALALGSTVLSPELISFSLVGSITVDLPHGSTDQRTGDFSPLRFNPRAPPTA